MASAAGLVPAPGQPQYTAAKHGVLGLTKQAAQEFAKAGIRVNAVLPGQTETAPMRAYLDALPDGGEQMLRRLPMGRMATTDEIADSVVWLCSDRRELRERGVAHRRRRTASPGRARAAGRGRMVGMSGRVLAATLLSVATAFLYALSNVLQMLEAEKVPDEYALRAGLLARLDQAAALAARTAQRCCAGT